MTLAAVQARLGEIDQWLPVDGDPSQTLGQLVSINSTGPLRLGFGAWRDLLLGCQFKNGKGDLITAGGRTVKNVAGYDLTKFMVGQCGIFGRIVTITTRTHRRPDGAVIVLTETFPEAGRMSESVAMFNTMWHQPQWMMQIESDKLLCGYLGDTRTLDFYAGVKPRSSYLSLERISLDEEITLRGRHWNANLPGQGRRVFRAGIPPRSLDWPGHFCTSWASDPMFGVVVGHSEAGNEAILKRQAEQMRGTITFYDEHGLPDAVSTAPRELLVRLKAALDPHQTLAPLPA